MSDSPTVDSRSPEARREFGSTIVEYSLLIALIAVVVIAALRSLGVGVSDSFEKANYLGFAGGGGMTP